MSDSNSDREGRPVDPARLRVELTRAGNYLYNQGIGDGSAAVDDANRELDRLRAEVERLKAPEGWEDELNAAWAIVNQVRAEVEGLREALREIRDACDEPDPIFTAAAAALSRASIDEQGAST